MRLSIVLGMAVLGGLFMAANVMAQAPGGGRGGRGGGPGGMFQADPFQQTIDALGDVNLRPDFNLSKEQKEKLQAVREDVKKAADKWRSDHQADLTKIQTDMQAAMQDQDQDKAREARGKLMELMATQPKTDEAVTKVKALLSEDQAKALETRITERQQEQRDRMGAMGGGRGGRRGGGGGGGQ